MLGAVIITWLIWSYLSIKIIFWKIFEGEMFIITQLTILHRTILEEDIYHLLVIFKKITNPDDNFKGLKTALMYRYGWQAFPCAVCGVSRSPKGRGQQ